MEQSEEKRMRLDKWLKIARIYKTRSKASEACEQGRVMVNEQTAKAAKMIKIGDTLSVKTKWRKRVFDIVDLSNKSISAANARLLYQEHELSPEEQEIEQQRILLHKASKGMRPKYKGRPTKKEGRIFRKKRGW